MNCFKTRVFGLNILSGPTLGIAALVLLIATTSTVNAGERRFTFVYEAPTLPQGAVEYEQWIT